MRKEMADALIDFYQKILKPEFDSIRQKQAEHDERFSEISGHIESIYHRIARLDDEFLALNNRVERMEQTMKSMKLGSHNHDQLEKRVGEMKEQLTALQSRLDALEQQLADGKG